MIENPLPHEQRVIDEKAQLDERLVNLNKFLSSEVFSSLDKEDMLLLGEQEVVMKKYSAILDKRIRRFEITRDMKS